MERTIEERILQRRLQMLVHSYLYYEMDENIVSDSKWSKWAMELVDLQSKYPKVSRIVKYADMFKTWDGSSGAFLTYDDDTIRKAKYLLEIRNETPNKMVFRQKLKKLF